VPNNLPTFSYLELQQRLIQHHQQFGYEWKNVPIIGNADLFLARAGNTIIEKLFTFERNGKLMSLRPEFTTMAMDTYIRENHKATVRWQFFGETFEDIPSQFATQSQHLSAGIELIGISGVQADAEAIQVAFVGIQKLDITNANLMIGNVGLQQHILSSIGLDSLTIRFLMNQRDRIQTMEFETLLGYLSAELGLESASDQTAQTQTHSAQDLLNALLDSTQYGSTMGGRTRQEIAQRIERKRSQSLTSAQLRQALNFLKTWFAIHEPVSYMSEIANWIDSQDVEGHQLLHEWQATIQTLIKNGIPAENISIKSDLTQNWDYYTGIVFAIQADDSILVRGGRYDELGYLISQKQRIPAIGFAYSLDTLLA
jgi:ATP phosphoribosyltransferase regulatory subunit HisZ